MPAARPWAELRAVGAAASFLTRLPLEGRGEAGAEAIGRGCWAFPLAGAAVGAFAVTVALAVDGPATPLVAAALAVSAALLLTGALHLDGLADSADGLGGSSRERALEIMRDHSVGAYGAAAIGLDLILKTALVAALLERSDVLIPLLVAAAISRASVLPLALALPYARAAPGPGAALSGRLRGGRVALALAIAVGLAVATAALQGLVAVAWRPRSSSASASSPGAAWAASPATSSARPSSWSSSSSCCRSSSSADPSAAAAAAVVAALVGALEGRRRRL